MRVYHRTAHAEVILREGFRDGSFVLPPPIASLTLRPARTADRAAASEEIVLEPTVIRRLNSGHVLGVR